MTGGENIWTTPRGRDASGDCEGGPDGMLRDEGPASGGCLHGKTHVLIISAETEASGTNEHPLWHPSMMERHQRVHLINTPAQDIFLRETMEKTAPSASP